MTSHYAVLGSPISHSKSPVIHQTAFDFYGLSADYSAIELSENLAEFVAGLSVDWKGLSLTMPLKEQALNLADRVDSIAIAANAANTLVRSEAGWDAYNTDVFGIQMALRQLSFKNVCVIGTGATARSAIVAMQELGKAVTVWGRNKSSIAQLTREFEIEEVEKFHIAVKADLVISTLPKSALDEHLSTLRERPSGYLLDVIYEGWPTKAATTWGLEKSISGLEMLLWQAIGQQRLFAGNDLESPLANEKELVTTIKGALDMAK